MRDDPQAGTQLGDDVVVHGDPRAQRLRQPGARLDVQRARRLHVHGAGPLGIGEGREAVAGRARERGIEIGAVDLRQEPRDDRPGRLGRVAGERPGVLPPECREVGLEAAVLLGGLGAGVLEDRRGLTIGLPAGLGSQRGE